MGSLSMGGLLNGNENVVGFKALCTRTSLLVFFLKNQPHG